MLNVTNTVAPSVAPGEVLDIHAWALQGPALVGWPGSAVRRPACTLRACAAVDRATTAVLGAIVSGDPTEDLAPTALRMALSDKAHHARTAGARSDWNERALPLVIAVDADTKTMRRWRFPRLAQALGIDMVVNPRIRFRGERGLVRAIPAEAMSPKEDPGHTPPRDDTVPSAPSEALAARMQAALVRHLVDQHNRTCSRALGGRTPSEAWRDALGIHPVKVPTADDPRVFGAEGATRPIEPTGVRVFGDWYQDPVLQALRISGEGEAELRLDPSDFGRVDVRFGGAWHPVRRVAPPSHGWTSAERLAADLGWTRGVAAETGTLHLHHEGAWGGDDRLAAPRGMGE